MGDQSAVQSYVASEEKQSRLYRKTLWIVIFAQILGGAGLAAGVTVGALIAEKMLETESLAGLPAALFTLGSALAALIVGRISQRYGRRLGLTVGFLAGGLGAIGVIVATIISNIALLFFSLFIYGSGMATNLQARYAGTDLANATQRGKAVSFAMVATTFGAVAGPNLVDIMGDFAQSIGVMPLAGPFILAAVAYTLASIIPFLLLRPDPLVVSRAIRDKKEKSELEKTDEKEEHINRKGIILGSIVMIVSHFIMVAIMTMTPIYMEDFHFSMQQIGLVISIHIAGMYLPSLVTGILVDRYGRTFMIVASVITFILTSLIIILAPGESLFAITAALFLLGLGWNFGFISGTALIVDATPLKTRAETQGKVDVFVAIAGSTGGALSGVIVSGSNFHVLSIFGAVLAMSLFVALFWAKPASAQKDVR